MVASLQQTSPTMTQSLAQAPVPQEDIERKKAMDDAEKAFKGKLPDPLKVEKDQPNDNVKSNRCAPIVNKGVSFLFGQVVKIEVDKSDDDAPTQSKNKPTSANQQFTEGLWGDDDDRMTRLSKIAMNGGKCGQTFLKLIPAQGDMRYPRIVNLNPRICRIVSDPEDCDLHMAYVIEYPSANDWHKRQIIARIDPENDLSTAGPDDLEDTWTTTNYIRKGQTGIWLQVGIPEEWPYPFAPIFTCQNLPNPNDSWGIADLTEDLIQLNKVLNFILSCFARILKYHGHPKTIAKGTIAAQIEVAINDVICLQSPDADMKTLEMTNDLSSFLNFLADLRADMDEQSRVPAVALGRLAELPRGNISGIALQLLFQPLLEKTVQKQRLYGKLIREVTRAALVVSNKISVEQYEDYQVDIHWQDLLPNDDLNAAQVALILKQLGVSPETLLQRLGFDYDEEVAKNAEEDQRQLDMFAKGQGMPPPGMPMMQQSGQGQESPFIGRQ